MSTNIRRLAVAAVLTVLAVPSALPAQPSCTGDCDHSASVTVDEILRGVNIALGTSAISECESFDTNADDEVTVDELLASVNAALLGCAPPQQQAFVVTTDFSTGSFGTISFTTPRQVTPASAERQIHPDAVARTFGGLVYVINRFMGDSVQIIDPAADFVTRSRCLAGEELSNPHDIAFVNADKAYVSLYDRPRILIVDPTPAIDCTGFVLGSIDLTAYADGDGLPESDGMTIIDGRLYVLLQHLDRDNFFIPLGPGSLVVVDIATDTIVDEIALSSGNPFSQTNGLTVRDGQIVVAEVNEFGKSDGGIERVDPVSGVAAGFFVTEATLGGDITDFALVDEHLGYAVVSLADFSNQLVSFDPSTGAKGQTIASGGNYADIELNDRGELWVAESTFGAGGVRIFRAADGVELTDSPIELGLPPFSILFLK